MMLKTISLAVTAAAAIAIAAPANAFDFDGTVHAQRVVHYADLDIGHTAGAMALLTRITGAARTVCGTQPEFQDPIDQQTFRTCMNESIERAVAAVNNPLVSELHRNNQAPMSVAQRN